MSEDFWMSALRNFGFIRFLILFCAFNYFFHHKIFFDKILVIWSFTLLIMMADTYIESFTGTNMLGYGETYGKRIVSFFRNEPIVGGYINAFYLIIVGYFFSLRSKFSTNKYLIFLISLSFLLAIFLTGERSNAIKAIFGFLIFYFINDNFKIGEKLFSILLALIIIGSLIYKSDFLKTRYDTQLLKPIFTVYQITIKKMNIEETYFKEPFKSLYLDLYKSGFSVFKKYPFFGVGNKNYRIETCSENKKYNYVCNTHPHQTYLEFLSEHGFIGTMVILLILFTLIFGKIKIIFQSKNYIQIGCCIFLLSTFIPFLPSGSFFGDYNLTIFWLNLSLMYSVNKKTNIFSKD